MDNKDPNPFKTPLYEQHKALGARLIDFGGWLLPVNYSSQVDEHHKVRNDVGIFDVSHMTVSDISGNDTLDFLSTLLANDIHKIKSVPGKALYSCMLNETGGVIDDLIVYYLNDESCRMVTNAGTNQKDMAWLQKQAEKFDVTVTEKLDLALIAIQGPNAIVKTIALFENDNAYFNAVNTTKSLKRFQGQFADDLFIGRTGYTGEDGLEIILPNQQAKVLWDKLIQADIQPCGLGARDTLRLEAGMSLYGADLSEEFTPLDSGLAWTVSLKDEREFIGKSALLSPSKYQMIGLVLEDKGVLRGHQAVYLNDQVIGEITSGTFSPTLDQSIALARVDNKANLEIGTTVQIEIRKKKLNAKVVNYPFVKK